MEQFTQENKIRKSLAVDLKTYQRRSKIEQLKVLIEQEHFRLNETKTVEA